MGRDFCSEDARSSAMLVVFAGAMGLGVREVGVAGRFEQRFSLTRPAQGWKIMFWAGRGAVIPTRLRVPGPLAGRWARTGTMQAGARPRGEPKPAPLPPVSAAVHEVSRLELGHSRSARL